jgi:mono/diheme cytochrome c family protein
MRIKKNHWQCSLLAAVMFAVGLGAHVAQSAGGQRQTPEVKAVPYAAIQSVEGRENFTAYCAVCHGVDGRGNGPAAPAMKVTVPDLTTLAARHNGSFDAAAVEYVIRGTAKMATPAHGATEMPIWGRVFAPLPADQPVASMRVKNLVRYIGSIQRTK